MTMADHYPSASRSTVHGGAAALSSLGSSRAHRHAMKRINSMVFERQLRSSGPSFDHLPALVGEGWPVGPEASLFPPSGGTLRTSTSRWAGSPLLYPGSSSSPLHPGSIQ